MNHDVQHEPQAGRTRYLWGKTAVVLSGYNWHGLFHYRISTGGYGFAHWRFLQLP